MKKIAFIVSAFVLLMAEPVMAQDQDGNQRKGKFDVAEMYNKRATRLAKSMKLDGTDKDKFVALYLEYQTARNSKEDLAENDASSEKSKDMTDEKAQELILKMFDMRENQVKVDREYYAKFAEFLTPTQLLPVFGQNMMNNQGRDRRNSDSDDNRPPMGGGFNGGGFGGGPDF